MPAADLLEPMLATILCLQQSAERALDSAMAARELAEEAHSTIAAAEVRLFSKLNRRCRDIEDDVEEARRLALTEQMANTDTRLSISR